MDALPAGAHVIRELNLGECVELLRSSSIGRFVYTAGALPAVEPVSYVLDGYSVVFRLPGGVPPQGVAAFQVDQVNPATGVGWSVIVVDRVKPYVAGNGSVASIDTDLVRGAYLQFW